MGIPGFTKLFPAKKEIKLKDLKGRHIAIDAMSEIYRGSLGARRTNTLTDSRGRSTMHINTLLLGVIFKLKSFGIHQYWIFDNKYIKGVHNNPLKELELKKRAKKRYSENNKVENLKKKLAELEKDELFSSSEDEAIIESNREEILKCKKNIEKHKKRCFKIQEYHITDIQFILNCLNIPWVTAPYRINNAHADPYEAEQLAAMLTNDNIYGINSRIDYVLSPDADTLLFGSRKVIKRRKEKGKKNKLYVCDLEETLTENKISLKDLIKIGLILGTDFAPKTGGVGIKSIFKKLPKSKLKNKKFLETLTKEELENIKELRIFETVRLNERQKKAFNEIFTKKMTKEEITSMKWHNLNKVPFRDISGRKKLLDWLELVKGFKRLRIKKLLMKCI